MILVDICWFFKSIFHIFKKKKYWFWFYPWIVSFPEILSSYMVLTEYQMIHLIIILNYQNLIDWLDTFED